MAINKNHEFEDLDGVKCAIVEKNATPARVEFLKSLLERNRYTVVVVKSPPPKVAAPADPNNPPPVLPETFTVGVTDVTFNMINAVFGRLLHAPDGHIVTLDYWQQKDTIARDDVPYYEKNKG
jgi:hypothetical protein